jgi:hypothetical protein
MINKVGEWNNEGKEDESIGFILLL